MCYESGMAPGRYRLAVLAAFVLGAAGLARATAPVPEINPNSALAGLFLLGGALALVLGRPGRR